MFSFLLALALGATAPVATAMPAPTAGTQAAAAEDVFAEVRVNGVDTGLIVQFGRTGDDLTASGDDLRELGLDVAGGSAAMRLRSIPNLRYSIDEATQTVDIQVAPAAMRSVAIGSATVQGEEVRPAWGGLVNYSLYTDQSGHGGATGEARVFGPAGTFSSGMIARRLAGTSRVSVQRLDTHFVREDPRTLRRLTIGDFVSPDGSADGAVRGAGVQLATDFTLQPDLVTAPTPHLTGGDGLPSTVDLYVDGVRRLTQEVGAGRFAVSGVPMVDGAGQVSLLVRDALGHESVQQLSFYSSRQLLRPGLTASSVQVGLLRINAYAPGDRYGPAFGAAAVRRGIDDRLTGEVRFAAAAPVQVTGASITGKLGELALLSASGDLSHSRDGQGGEASLSLRRDGPRLSVFAVAQKSFGHFATLATYGAALKGWHLQAGGATQLAGLGQLSLSATLVRENDTRTRIVAASWSRPIGRRLAAFANVVHTRSGRSGLLVAAGFTIALSPRSAASVQAGHDPRGGSGSVTWSQSADPDGGASWRAGATDDGGRPRLLGGVTYHGRSGEIGADVQVDRTGPSAQMFASGAAVWLGARPELTAPVGQSFTRIETGQAGVGVMVQNRPVGRTRRDGSLLIANLPANTPARITLDNDGLDLDHEAERADLTIRPRGAGGSIVRMPVHSVDALTVQLVAKDGTPLPLGSIVRRADGRETVIGYDGLAYLTGIGDTVAVEVRNGDQRCRARLKKGSHEPIVCS